jgi:hypothetical protein
LFGPYRGAVQRTHHTTTYGFTGPGFVGPLALPPDHWSAPATSGGTMLGTPVMFQLGYPPSDGFHAHETMTVALPHKPYLVNSGVQPESLHGPLDWAIVVCAAGVGLIRPIARHVEQRRLRRWRRAQGG